MKILNICCARKINGFFGVAGNSKFSTPVFFFENSSNLVKIHHENNFSVLTMHFRNFYFIPFFLCYRFYFFKNRFGNKCFFQFEEPNKIQELLSCFHGAKMFLSFLFISLMVKFIIFYLKKNKKRCCNSRVCNAFISHIF